MSFVSLQFPIFFLVVCLVLGLLPKKARWAWLVAASCWFYMAFIPAYILILFVLIAVDYSAGLWIEKSQGAKRKWILIGSLITNVAMLAAFKYLNFALENVNEVFQSTGIGSLAWRFPWVLPIGLSFHTFQSMAYTIEVYKGKQKAERHLGIYSLYVLYFPQMVAGPIERPQNLLVHLREPSGFTWIGVIDGLKLMAWGLFKKVLVADRLAVYVDSVYANPKGHSGWEVLIASYFFAFQIYCDFSGYTDIARGAARVMGTRLMLNFNHPYISRSPAEFWHRWHISLSTWFRDYLFFPLGGSRGALWATCRNLFIVFIVSGFWHGAAWTFLAWGAIHGLFMVVQKLLEQSKLFVGAGAKIGSNGAGRLLQMLFTFHLVTFAWIFFRAKSMSDALDSIRQIVSMGSWADLGAAFANPAARAGVLVMALLVAIEWAHRRWHMPTYLAARPWYVRWLLWYGLLTATLLYGRFGNEQFLYFQF
jgi:alginate O-acetyltransferase complex protein AlgI